MREGLSMEVAGKEQRLENLEELKKQAETAVSRLAKIRHPLSTEGRAFLDQAKKVLDSQETSVAEARDILQNVPTVENPHLEYFKDVFENLPEEEKEKLYFNTSVIQTTRGCSHNCLHCAVSATPKLEVMPYVTVLKIAEVLQTGYEKTLADHQREADEIVNELHQGTVNREKIKEHLMEQWQLHNVMAYRQMRGRSAVASFCRIAMNGDFYEHASDQLIEHFSKEVPHIKDVDWRTLSSDERQKLLQEIVDAHRHLVTQQSSSSDSDAVSAIERLFLGSDYQEKKYKVVDQSWMKVKNSRSTKEEVEGIIEQALNCLEKSKNHPFLTGKDKIFMDNGETVGDLLSADQIKEKAGFVYNYWDSDPFDYRDMNVRDKNNNPADYGDVVRELERRGVDVTIVTAGWTKSDRIAQRAAEKIAQLGHKVSVSVHFYGREAQEDKEKYKESLKNVIKTLYPKIKIRWFGGKALSLVKNIFSELGLKPQRDSLSDEFITSIFSGRAKERKEMFEKESKVREVDIMSGIEGYLILPNGGVLYKGSQFLGNHPIARESISSLKGYNIY